MYQLNKCTNVLILLILTNPVNAGSDDVWRERVAREPSEVGFASIYSDRQTATGERFDGKALTCAHRTRPLCSATADRLGICPSRSYVTVRMAGRAIQCRVNDRGPWVKGRVIDLTQGAAKLLGLTWEQGIGKVTLD